MPMFDAVRDYACMYVSGSHLRLSVEVPLGSYLAFPPVYKRCYPITFEKPDFRLLLRAATNMSTLFRPEKQQVHGEQLTVPAQLK